MLSSQGCSEAFFAPEAAHGWQNEWRLIAPPASSPARTLIRSRALSEQQQDPWAALVWVSRPGRVLMNPA